MVHSRYHPLNHRPLSGSVWMVHSGYHPLKLRPVKVVFGWCAVDSIILNIVLLG